jgi:hypothetical protein
MLIDIFNVYASTKIFCWDKALNIWLFSFLLAAFFPCLIGNFGKYQEIIKIKSQDLYP